MFRPGDRAYWCGTERVQLVDHTDRKLLNQHRRVASEDLVLVVTSAGQLVWVQRKDLRLE